MKIATERNENGQFELFVLLDGEVYTSRQVGSETEWTEWERLDGAEGTSIAVGRNEDGRLEVFVTDPSNGTYHNRRETADSESPVGDWEGWRPLADDPRPGGSVAVAPNGDRRLEVFVTDPTTGTFHTRQTEQNGTAWTDWKSRGDRAGDEIVVERDAEERLQVFLLNYADEGAGLTEAEKEFLYGVHHCWQVEPDGDEWADWHRRGRANGHSLAVGENEDGRFMAFLVRDDDVPIHIRQVGFEDTEWEETWSELSYPEDFEIFHRPKAKSVAAGRDAAGRVVVFITGRRLHSLAQQSPNGDWSLWERFGKVRCAGLDVARTADRRLVVFGLEDDESPVRRPKVHQRWQREPNGRWSKWWSRTI
ncbi:hypothetical protein [Haladaptatus sp. T7]|uniref:hypothetical protein n=1 Tax=Haladaptatus sp. T7 TaxID=2029368 RepID=UPI0021A25835|nr:hypothetical protein [Haladaptatus sp. T7]GKZ14397.1 hypothetical protein HAL_22780 [Haladaptatus sp. T7]